MDSAQSKFYNEGVQSRKRFRFGHRGRFRCPGKGVGMTIQEASERYRILLHILREYKRWGLCRAVKDVMGAWQYDQTDIAAWLSQNGLTES